MSDLPPPPPPSSIPPPERGAATSQPAKPFWKRWWVIALAVVIVLVVVAAIAGGGGGDEAEAPGTTAAAATPTDESATMPEPSTDPEPSVSASVADTSAAPSAGPSTAAASPDDATIGTTIETGSGGLARVNAVTPNAPPRNDLLGPEPGFTFTEAEVEICAGEDGQSTNPLYWKAFLADNTEADVSFTSDLQTVGLRPGGCSRGWVAFSVPDGAAVADIVLTDNLFSETARWSAGSSSAVTGPLTPFQDVEAGTVGTALDLDGGGTAVVRSITPNAAPSSQFITVEPGRQLVEIDVELCAGTEPLSVNPLYWLVTAADHYIGGASLGGGTLSSLDIAPGQCAAGTVQVDMLEQSVPAYVILTDEIFDEAARWAP